MVKKSRKKFTKEKKIPYVVYISPKLKAKFKAYAKKKDIFLTDAAEMIFSKFFRAN